ncbi:MAG: hypothetical protein ACOC2W_00230 [bacterium]
MAIRLNTTLGMLDFEKPTKYQEGRLCGPITCVNCDENMVDGHVRISKNNKYYIFLKCDACGEVYE